MGEPKKAGTCFAAGGETPCWGLLETFSDSASSPDGGYMFTVTACQGHLPVYDDEPYKPEPVSEPAPPWRAMDTAPKDGTAFLAVENGHVSIVQWHVTEQRWVQEFDGLGHAAPERWAPLPPVR